MELSTRQEFCTYLYLDPSRQSALHSQGEPIYVGKGLFHKNRHLHHLTRTDRHPLTSRIKKLRKAGVEPIIALLANDIDEELAHLVEVEAIAKFGRKDLKKGPLLNLTDGGEGASNRVVLQSTRSKQSASIRAALADPELKERWLKSQKAANENPEVRARRSAAAKAAQNRPEVKEAHVRANASGAAERRRLAASLALKRPEVRSKLSDSLKAYWARRKAS